MVNGSPQRPGKLHYTLSPEQRRSRRLRNIALALGIGLMVVLFYALTIAKLGTGFITNRPM